MRRALLRGAGCRSCQHESFRSLLGVNAMPRPRQLPVLRPHFRRFSAVGTWRSDRPPNLEHPESHLSATEEGNEARGKDDSASVHVPWYLQEKPPIPESHRATGDLIPNVPENSPEMLSTLLEYSYKDLGLDSLKLFDLRALDIPAALGANTIMIIGTARSVKHLNVSADRLCRWLRSTYKLAPFADGLLGRNELKIKLRRKAKRARAASNSGTIIDEKDDGITTGWICVNAGVVDKDVARTQLSDAGFEGFGQVDAGTSVVVQIFTEEKRADVDLDGLWQKILDRAERKRHEDFGESPQTGASTNNRAPGSVGTFRQTRNFHTTIGKRAMDMSMNTSLDQSALATNMATKQVPGTGVNTESLLEMLVGLSHESARKELGTGPEDHESTVFLRLLHQSLPQDASSEDTATLYLRLSSIAVSRQHPTYSKDMLFSVFNKFLVDGYALSDKLAFEVVAALLAPRLANDHAATPALYLPEADIELAFQVLDRLHFRGIPILNYQVFNLLYQVVQTPRMPSAALNEGCSVTETTIDQLTESQSQMLTRLSKIIRTAEVPFDEHEARKLMVTLFRFEDYDQFWHLWRMFPLKGVGRTPEDYTQLFQLHADLGSETRARECLSMWVPMMERENTPIPLQGSVVDSIRRCLLVADPGIASPDNDSAPSFFWDTWMRCQPGHHS
ncbi:ATPase synthesis protein 25 [Penicillium capsulatum]|uniref:ATPase synthesis protein 25 n=1 Tax=Penicillium capsulatum TaxID=69766 RepID=A0A9W9LMF6_9EURO|nr:ATPase synthesis protein 25 [Penicillium capsulatum]KAJ6108991.1 ATPase synthesis protein 25 [Penicillium capsulatum]